ncbi:MAG: winged helix-turn-helix transcriptional regulator [Solirubrobacterales bacterium]
MASKTVDQAAELLRERLKELDAERSQIQRALASITGGREGRRGPGRPRGSGSPAKGGRKRGRRNTRSEQAVKLIGGNPGISASEIAKQLKIKPNYMYRVLGDLQKEGRIKKDGRSYSAA